MGLGDLLIPAVGGYLFLIWCNQTKYRVKGYSGYQLLLHSLSCGIVLLIISYIISIYAMGHPKIQSISELAIFPKSTLLLAAILSFPLGPIFACLWNIFYRKAKAQNVDAKTNNNHIGGLIDDATEKQLPIQITLDDGKIYVGEPLDTRVLRRSENAEIAIIPWRSGHRNKNTGEMSIDIDYVHVIIDSLEDGKMTNYEDFRLVIPLSRVVSARLFNTEVYHRFLEQR